MRRKIIVGIVAALMALGAAGAVSAEGSWEGCPGHHADGGNDKGQANCGQPGH